MRLLATLLGSVVGSLFFAVLFLGNYYYTQTHTPCMDKALAACDEACNNDPVSPHQVGNGKQDETYVDCYCKGYKQYDYHPEGP